jgi:16S rRNA (cytosine1402-N4)-methyltransferase
VTNQPSVTSVTEPGHAPVLLEEAIEALQVRQGGVYLDGTFGGGGHARRILDASAPDGRLVAVDADVAAIQRAEALRASLDRPERLVIVHTNLRHLDDALRDAGVDRVDGVLFDLGVSSYQLDTAERGFSFRHDAPLDMRFDQTRGPSAADLLQTLPETEIADLLFRFGEERRSRRIARDIVAARAPNTQWTTGMLARLVERSIGRKSGAIHPATRTFQALRIAVNGELDAIAPALDAATERLRPGGRLVVIAFHSLEDRIVKQLIADAGRTCICPPEQPVCTCGVTPWLRRIGRPVRPSPREIETNPRSRSSIMRVAERVPPGGPEEP